MSHNTSLHVSNLFVVAAVVAVGSSVRVHRSVVWGPYFLRFFRCEEVYCSSSDSSSFVSFRFVLFCFVIYIYIYILLNDNIIYEIVYIMAYKVVLHYCMDSIV